MGAGRKRGGKNAKTAAIAHRAAAQGITPLEYMLDIMRDENADPVARMDMAKAAAPYIHPRLAAVEHSTDPQKPLRGVLMWGAPN